MRPVTTILVPTDFSAASLRAVSYARELADALGATLHLLHVFENPFAAGAFMDMYTPASDEYVGQREADVKQQLEALLTGTRRNRQSTVVAARMGLPSQQILEYVEEHGAIDLIVIAGRGRSRVERLITGSVAETILRSAPCPVLMLHAHDRVEAGAKHRAA